MMTTYNYNKPIKIAITYSLITILLYEFGPISFPNYNKILLYFFLLACNIAMFAGFTRGTKYAPAQSKSVSRQYSIDKFLNILFWISLIICIPKFMIFTGIFDNVFPTIALRISHYADFAQESYFDRHDLGVVTGVWVYINYAVILLGPFHWAYIPLSLLFFKRLRLWKKCLTIIIWFIYLAQYLCTGTNVGVFTFLFTFGVVYVIKNRILQNKKKRHKLRTIIIPLVVILVFLGMFNLTMGSRSGATYENESDYSVCGSTCSVNSNSVLYNITPQQLRPLLFSVTAYVAKPYATLLHSFDLPFKPTFGIGYSWFLLDNAPYSKDLWEQTYPVQLERRYQYSHSVNWHTAYTWFANDVSWFGVPIVLYFLFVCFGRSWRRFIDCDDIFSFLLFMLFVRFVLFISMNNQVFQQPDTLFAFWILVAIRALSKPYTWKIR